MSDGTDPAKLKITTTVTTQVVRADGTVEEPQTYTSEAELEE